MANSSWWWIIWLLTLGCAVTIPVTQNQSVLQENVSEEPEHSIAVPLLNKSSAEPCPGRFICISSIVRAYQDQNCHISNRTTCETECLGGVCQEKMIRICTAGFKCRNQYSRGFQREDCSWDKQEKCEFGCSMKTNKCANQSTTANQSETSPLEPSNVKNIVNYPTLSFGQTIIIEEQNLTIYTIEAERVQLKLGSQRSGWIGEGQAFQFKNGVAITIREILLQPYDGGKKQVAYSIN